MAPSVIYGILRNTAYIGERVYNRHESVEPDADRRRKAPKPGKSKKTSQALRSEDHWIRVPCPAIISRELFDQVQAQLVRNRRKAGRPAHGIC